MILAALSMFAVFMSKPVHVHGQQPTPDAHHPEAIAPAPPASGAQGAMMNSQGNMMAMMDMMSHMKATDPKLDELVKKMNAAKGSAKVDAMAELLTALVEDRKTGSEPMMGNMMNMMSMMSGGRGAMPMTPQK
jgi:hypothetical protein